MKAWIRSFRRGRHTQNPRQFILEIEGVKDKEKAEKFVGKSVIWVSKGNKKIRGKISAPHGNKGRVRAVFEKGLPGYAINDEVRIEWEE